MYEIVIEEIPYLSPQNIFEKLKHHPYPFLLESSLATSNNSYSFVGCKPYRTLSAPLTLAPQECLHLIKELDSLSILQKQIKPVPFIGGAVGFISYDFGRCLEDIPDRLQDDIGLPYFQFAFYNWLFAFDHNNKKSYIVSTGFPENNLARYYARAKENISFAKSLLREVNTIQVSAQTITSPTVNTALDQHEYQAVVQKAIDYIKAGDIFQVNISQRFEIFPSPSAWEAYQNMTAINPAPFSAFLSYPNFEIASSSPERFIKKTGNQIITSPIKGTRKRGFTELEDEKMREELWTSEKDRAELAMIIDLERNDLNKFCIPGSVHVPELYRLEKFPSVWHLVSDVHGSLEDCWKFSDIIANAFPGGSITGAPKIRSMEIIEELEGVRRGLYTGAIGYLSFDGDFDFNIVIRTAIFKDNRAYLQTGGGITALSNPQFEYEETLIKAKKIFEALGVKNYANFSI